LVVNGVNVVPSFASTNNWSNVYSNTVGVNANNWSNVYANQVGTNANTYASSVGVNANTWANSKVYSITSNSTSRVWANTITTSGYQNVYIDLATSGVTATTYGGASAIPVITIDAYGRVTAAANQSVTSGGVTSLSQGTGLSFSANPITTTGTISLASGIVTAQAWTGGISAITTDTYGRVTSVTASAGYLTSAVTSLSQGTGLSFSANPITTTGTISIDYTTFNAGTPAQSMTVTSLSDSSGTISWDASTSRMATVTMSGTGRTMANPTNLKAGSYILIIKQDATGSRTITTWGSVFKWPAAVAPVLSTTASTTDVFSFWCDGTNLYGTYIPDCR